MNRSRRGFLWMTAGVGITGVAFRGRHRRYERESWALGTTTKIILWHDDARAAERALDESFQVIERVEAAMSLYRPESELSQWNARGFLDEPSEDLVRVIAYAQALSRRTAGAFDITVQPLWGKCQELVSQDALKLVGWEGVKISPKELRFVRPGMRVTLNGIAQGYAADRVRAHLSARGIQHALVDTGEHGALGQSRDQAWKLALQHPREPESACATVALADRCLATSGDYATAHDETLTAHHVVDPRTGRSPGELASVSVAAPTAMEADALSTAVFVLGLERGQRLIEATPGVDAVLVPKDGQGIVVTAGFPLVRFA